MVTVRPGSIKPARPTPLGAGGPEGQASDDKGAPDICARWLGEVVFFGGGGDDAQHFSGASVTLRQTKSKFMATRLGRLKAVMQQVVVAILLMALQTVPQDSGQGVLEVIGAHVMETGDASTGAVPAVKDRTFFRHTDSLACYWAWRRRLCSLGKLVGATGAASPSTALVAWWPWCLA